MASGGESACARFGTARLEGNPIGIHNAFCGAHQRGGRVGYVHAERGSGGHDSLVRNGCVLHCPVLV